MVRVVLKEGQQMALGRVGSVGEDWKQSDGLRGEGDGPRGL